MSQQEKVAKNLERFRNGVLEHNVQNPDHPPAYGVGLSHFDLQCLGFEEGEELWAGVRVLVDGGTTGNFRVLCNAEPHGKTIATARAEKVLA